MENVIVIKRFLGLVRGKNDKIDAERIALYAIRFHDSTLWQLQREVVVKLKHLFTMHHRLITSPLANQHYKVSKKVSRKSKKIDDLIKSDQ